MVTDKCDHKMVMHGKMEFDHGIYYSYVLKGLKEGLYYKKYFISANNKI